MILGVDIGGTKTLFALFKNGLEPEIIRQKKIPTPDKYEDFKQIVKQISDDFAPNGLEVVSFAVPGPISSDQKSVPSLGNRDWENMNFVDDFLELLKCPVVINNDAKLGALSEAISGAGQNHSVSTYITLSTGIGIGVIVDKKIEPEMSRDEVGMMPFERNGKVEVWEDFASARAFNNRYGVLATETDDSGIWDEFSQDIALGLSHIVLTINSDVIILGGPVGSQFDKFDPHLLKHLNNYLSVKKKLLAAPKIVKAKHPNKCVVRGCFYAAKQLLD